MKNFVKNAQLFFIGLLLTIVSCSKDNDVIDSQIDPVEITAVDSQINPNEIITADDDDGELALKKSAFIKKRDKEVNAVLENMDDRHHSFLRAHANLGGHAVHRHWDVGEDALLARIQNPASAGIASSFSSLVMHSYRYGVMLRREFNERTRHMRRQEPGAIVTWDLENDSDNPNAYVGHYTSPELAGGIWPTRRWRLVLRNHEAGIPYILTAYPLPPK